MSVEKPTFSINSYDKYGDYYEKGIYLHFGDSRIKVADDTKEFAELIVYLQEMKTEIEEN